MAHLTYTYKMRFLDSTFNGKSVNSKITRYQEVSENKKLLHSEEAQRYEKTLEESIKPIEEGKSLNQEPCNHERLVTLIYGNIFLSSEDVNFKSNLK